MAVLFKYKGEYFGDYKKEFIQEPVGQSFYWVVMGGRVLLAGLLVGANSVDAIGFVCMILPVAMIVLIAVKKPYLRGYNNYRMIANECILLVTLGIYGYYRLFTHPTGPANPLDNILPYVLIGLLFGCIIMNAAFMVKLKYDQVKQSKSAKQHQVEAQKA